MSKIRTGISYFKYLLRAQTKHDVHSPFVFNLLTTVIQNNELYYLYGSIEKLRNELLNDPVEVQVTDLGAGSVVLKTGTRKISDITRHSLKSAKYSQLLFRLVNHFKPNTILELGTSLGITTLYMAIASSQTRVVSIEGSKTIAQYAKQNFEKLNIKNIQLTVGNFDDVLQSRLNELKHVDLVFFDGNHRKEPTLRYFGQCLQCAHNDSVFIFDDIHWSVEMEQAWEYIKKHDRVTLTVDLFFIGIVFFRKEQVKEHFVLRY
ncbi:MAG: class I SAM-dependent methyltransferase [Bacteroidetes bacterium]|nr:class I SAM-dependent methyltransferase [Bacteroidota bacterium]